MRLLAVLGLSLAFVASAVAQPLALSTTPTAHDLPLSRDGVSTPLLLEPGLDPAVARAAADMRTDLARVTGHEPALLSEVPLSARAVVLVGIVDRSPLLDQLARAGKFDAAALRGAWESFVIQTVEQPFPGVDQALVIAGSDRRGAIYGLYEISAAIGVSPWHWWADVPPAHRDSLVIAAGTRRFGPPSVKYRGIFLNDEDWGLQPWAAKTFDPEYGNIGPKTYAKVFELLLRLKANTLWPAMHACTAPFNADPANARLAADYGIAMGSSHAEPMLRNNVREWTAPNEQYNYVSNRDAVLRYWEERVAANAAYESIFTLGMRGIHDSHMVGPRSDAERVATLHSIFADQRELLARHVSPQVERVPQIFCAYKEVLQIYRHGLRVPDDVTIVWPDDNFGYVRDFASPAERTRSGGFGVYYHLSYLGRPFAYLWLSTTPPALIWEEMRKAYDHGADRLWIANVGDLKPAEIPTEFFLQMAWDIDRWRPDNLDAFLHDWAARNFGPDHAVAIAALLADYYRLNFSRRPEHLQWWLPKEPHRPSDLSDSEVQARLAAFADLRRRAETLRAAIPREQADAFFQLVYYPAVGSALANERYFAGERGDLDAATAADTRLKAETRFFNQELAGGKWRGLMNLEPADQQWSSMRLAPWTPPPAEANRRPLSDGTTPTMPAAASLLANATGEDGARWTEIPGLGRSGRAVTILPFTAPARSLAESALAPRLDYTLEFPASGAFTLHLHVLPTHPIFGTAHRFAVALDEQPPQLVELQSADGDAVWTRAVLDNERLLKVPLAVPNSGRHLLHLWGLAPGIVIDRVRVAATAPAR